MIDPNSRYYRSERATWVGPDGVEVPYLKRRILPKADGRAGPAVTVAVGQRLDVLAARYQGDPLQFWRIADANDAMNPFDLVVSGTPLRVPRPGQ